MEGIEAPYVQLAAQRVVRDGRVVGGPDDLQIFEHLPPRLQALLNGQRELYTT